MFKIDYPKIKAKGTSSNAIMTGDALPVVEADTPARIMLTAYPRFQVLFVLLFLFIGYTLFACSNVCNAISKFLLASF